MGQNLDSTNKKPEIVKHFENEGIPRRTIYDAINRLQYEGSIKEKKENRPHNLLDSFSKELTEKTGQ